MFTMFKAANRSRFEMFALLALASYLSGALSYWIFGDVLPLMGGINLFGYHLFPNYQLSEQLTGDTNVLLFSEEGFTLFRGPVFDLVLVMALLLTALGWIRPLIVSALWAVGFVGRGYGLTGLGGGGFTGFYAVMGPPLYFTVQCLVVLIGAAALNYNRPRAVVASTNLHLIIKRGKPAKDVVAA